MNYYEILGIPQDATPEEIEGAYHAQIVYFSPDVFPGDQSVARKKAAQLNEAYATLADPKRRMYYNAYLYHTELNPESYTCSDYKQPVWEGPKKKKQVFTPKVCVGIIIFAFLIPVLASLFSEWKTGSGNNKVNPTDAINITDEVTPNQEYFIPTSDSFTNGYYLAQGKIPRPVSEPISGQMIDFDDSLNYIAPFTIETRGDKNYYIKLKDYHTNKVILTTFVSGGDTAELEVPLGDYELLYATGDDWYGIDLLFWEKTQYFKAEDIFEFYEENGYVNGWTVELYLQNNGNLSTEEISADEF